MTAVAFLVRTVVVAFALWVATLIVPGIDVGTDGSAQTIGTLVAVALIFGVVNAVVKPVIKTIGCPLYVLTLGLIGLVVNALLFMLVGWLAGVLNLPFAVTGFGPALVGAIVVAVVAFILHVIIPDRIDQR